MNYAYIVDGLVYEVITPRTWDVDVYAPDGETIIHHVGDEIAITDRYTPEFLSQCVEIPDGLDVQQRWTYDGSTFAAPVPDAPSPADILANNTAQRDALMATAADSTYGMADAYVAGLLDDADTATFKVWAKYKLALSKVDLTRASPPWPTAPTA